MPSTLLGGIVINEVLPDPNSTTTGFNTDTDGSGRARGRDEFLELKNTSSSSIDISGLELWDDGRGNWFTFPPGSVLEPGARAVVVRDVQSGGSLPAVSGDDLAFDANFGSNVFNNGGDNLVVYDPLNDEYIQATYNGDSADDPVADYSGFSATATLSGTIEDFGNDIDGTSIQRVLGGFENNENATPGTRNICFMSGTRIRTATGWKRVEALRPGDLVVTADAGLVPVHWCFARRIEPGDLADDPMLVPIEIDAGEGRRIRVSRHHRIAVSRRGIGIGQGADEPTVLIPAKDLLNTPAARPVRPNRAFHYVHVLLDSHCILNADGVAAESLFLGPQAWEGMTANAKAELMLLFPDGIPKEVWCPVESGHVMVSGARARRMLRTVAGGGAAINVAFAEQRAATEVGSEAATC